MTGELTLDTLSLSVYQSVCPLEEKVFSIREQPIEFACWLGSLAQLVEHQHIKLRVVGSSPAGVHFFFHFSFHHSDDTAVSFPPHILTRLGWVWLPQTLLTTLSIEGLSHVSIILQKKPRSLKWDLQLQPLPHRLTRLGWVGCPRLK